MHWALVVKSFLVNTGPSRDQEINGFMGESRRLKQLEFAPIEPVEFDETVQGSQASRIRRDIFSSPFTGPLPVTCSPGNLISGPSAHSPLWHAPGSVLPPNSGYIPTPGHKIKESIPNSHSEFPEQRQVQRLLGS